MTAKEILNKAVKELVELGGSDIHFVPNQQVGIRVRGKLIKLPIKTTSDDTVNIYEILLSTRPPTHQQLIREQFKNFLNCGFSAVWEGNRFRVNASMKVVENREGRYIVLREIKENPPKLNTLGFSQRVLAGINKVIAGIKEGKVGGLLLVVGATGSGKSTTLASIIDKINEIASLNIITLEDPIEYVHKPKQSQIVQKEQGADFIRFSHGLRSALREDPDVILVGEIRDKETLKLALESAETGHLVFSTLHTNDAVSTIERLVSMGDSEREIRDKIAKSLRGIIAQKLLEAKDGKKRVLVYEFLYPTIGIRNLIKEGKDMQVYAELENSPYGQTFEETLAELVAKGELPPERAYSVSLREQELLAKFKKYGIEFDPSQVEVEADSIISPSQTEEIAKSGEIDTLTL